MNSKSKTILAHLTPIGWLLAMLINSRESDSSTGFYLAQTLGIYIIFFLTWFIPNYYVFAWGFFFVFWIYSFASSLKGEDNLVPFIGIYFQKWFRKIFR